MQSEPIGCLVGVLKLKCPHYLDERLLNSLFSWDRSDRSPKIFARINTVLVFVKFEGASKIWYALAQPGWLRTLICHQTHFASKQRPMSE